MTIIIVDDDNENYKETTMKERLFPEQFNLCERWQEDLSFYRITRPTPKRYTSKKSWKKRGKRPSK